MMKIDPNIPEVPTKGFLGDALKYKKDPFKYLANHSAKYGDTFSFRVVRRKLIYTSNPNFVQQLLQEKHTKYRKNLAYRKLKSLLGEGLFTAEGEEWLKHRRIAAPAFHKQRLQDYFNKFISISEKKLNNKTNDILKNPIDVKSFFTDLTLEIIASTLLGIEGEHHGFNIIEKHLPPALQFMIDRIIFPLNLPLWVPIPSHIKFKQNVKALYEIIDLHINDRLVDSSKHFDLVAMMIDYYKDNEIDVDLKYLREEILTFFLAGHETTAMALTWAIYYIGNDEKLQEALAIEIKDVACTFENLSKLTLLNKVIKETLRIKSPVWIMGREAKVEDRFNQYKIYPENSIIFSPALIHQDVKFFTSPNNFNPYRWTVDFEVSLPKYAYFPFGGGPRLCIGNHFAIMEMQVILYLFLKKYKSFKISNEVENQYSLTLRPDKKFYLQ